MFTRRAAFKKILKPRAALIQVKSKNKDVGYTATHVLFFTDSQRGAIEKKVFVGLIHARSLYLCKCPRTA